MAHALAATVGGMRYFEVRGVRCAESHGGFWPDWREPPPHSEPPTKDGKIPGEACAVVFIDRPSPAADPAMGLDRGTVVDEPD